MKTINITGAIVGIVALLTMPANAYDGYNIPCGEGSDYGSCLCDVGTCRDFAGWDDTLGTFICDGEAKIANSCTCTDASQNRTFTFTCGCHTDEQCNDGYGCNTSTFRCEKCKTCTGAGTSSWITSGTGRQYRTIKTCNCNGTLSTRTEYRCIAGYYVKSGSGASLSCQECPTWPGVYSDPDRTSLAHATSSAGATTEITGCYFIPAFTYYDVTGKFTLKGACFYTK